MRRRIGCFFEPPAPGEKWTSAVCLGTGDRHVKYFTVAIEFDPVGKTLGEILNESNRLARERLRFHNLPIRGS